MLNKRQEMVDVIRGSYGLDSPKVFSAMVSVDRGLFAPKRYRNEVYKDHPIDIGYGQTMSQPYTVAFMTHLLLGDKEKGIGNKIKKWRVLEIGTGSGYQSAILSKLVNEVYSVEVVPELARKA